MPSTKLIFTLAALVLISSPAHAYIGPGAGAGTIAVVLGVLASIIMGFFAILWYPVKRLLKKGRSSKDRGRTTASHAGEQ